MQNMGCMNVMLYLMPVLSVWFAFQVPAGVGYYWMWSSVFSLVITVGLNFYFNDKRTVAINEKEKEKPALRLKNIPKEKLLCRK